MSTLDPGAEVPAGTTVAAPLGHPDVPWHARAGVTVHEGKAHVRLGFSEFPMPLAEALVFAAELLEAFGYTYQIHRVEDLAGIEPTC